MASKFIDGYIEMIKDGRTQDDCVEEEIQNLKNGMKVKIGGEIEVNDYGVYAIIEGKGVPAHLVIEEDGSVRWYVNYNEHSDFVIRQVNVKFIRER